MSSKSPKRSRSKSSGKSKSNRKSSKGKGVKKHTYVEMIQSALMTLNEKGGSTRQEIWKFINT